MGQLFKWLLLSKVSSCCSYPFNRNAFQVEAKLIYRPHVHTHPHTDTHSNTLTHAHTLPNNWHHVLGVAAPPCVTSRPLPGSGSTPPSTQLPPLSSDWAAQCAGQPAEMIHAANKHTAHKEGLMKDVQSPGAVWGLSASRLRSQLRDRSIFCMYRPLSTSAA